MDVRSPLNQCIALALAGILFLQPIVVTAAELAVDRNAGSNTQLGQAGNGVPIVNIATPNGSGLSHNRFSEYNVGQQGLILNNATGKTQSTQLGGLIEQFSNQGHRPADRQSAFGLAVQPANRVDVALGVQALPSRQPPGGWKAVAALPGAEGCRGHP